MTRAEADTLAAELNAKAPVGVRYEVAETVPPKGDITPFYVRRRVKRNQPAAEQEPDQQQTQTDPPAGAEQLTLTA